jgi:hypothetical protein
MVPTADNEERLFAIVGQHDHHLANLCPGPSASGDCSRIGRGVVPCAGARVVPMRGTRADGLIFTVPGDHHGPRCPMAWVDEGNLAEG